MELDTLQGVRNILLHQAQYLPVQHIRCLWAFPEARICSTRGMYGRASANTHRRVLFVQGGRGGRSGEGPISIGRPPERYCQWANFVPREVVRLVRGGEFQWRLVPHPSDLLCHPEQIGRVVYRSGHIGQMGGVRLQEEPISSGWQRRSLG
jgi:hypothetical protein